MADLDEVNARVDLSGAAAAKWHIECGGAHVATASQPEHYYDLWALRTEFFDVNSWVLEHRKRVVNEGLAAFFPRAPDRPRIGDGGVLEKPRSFPRGYDVRRAGAAPGEAGEQGTPS